LLDAAINARGIRANVPFLQAANVLALQERRDVNARIAELTAGAVTSVHQPLKLKNFINARGHNMTSFDKRSVAATLAHDPDDVSRELLELRQRGAHQNVFERLLAYADPSDERIRGALRYHGAGPGRWTSPGAQLHGLSRNDADYPAVLIDALIAGNHAELARFGDFLKVIGQLERAALCAADGYELHCADLSMIESRITAWVAGEAWKLAAFKRYDESNGDKGLDPYRVFAHRTLQSNSPVSEISAAERQLGKCGELACGFGGGFGAWRRIAKDEDVRSDDEVKAIVRGWRIAHPKICAFWERLARCAQSSIYTGKPSLVSTEPRIVTNFDGYALTIALPNGRIINYPGAHLVRNEKFVNIRDIEFMDNANGQWKPVRAWHGILTENVVQGIARDLLAAAIVRAEARGWKVVHHAHDELVVEAPIDAISAQDVLALLLEAPPWAAGLPLGGKVRSGPLYFEAGEAAPTVEQAQRESPILSNDFGGAPDSPPHVCVLCKLNSPDGTERQVADDTWLHPRCEDAYIRARMIEDGTWRESTAPAPPLQSPPSPAPAPAPAREREGARRLRSLDRLCNNLLSIPRGLGAELRALQRRALPLFWLQRPRPDRRPRPRRR